MYNDMKAMLVLFLVAAPIVAWQGNEGAIQRRYNWEHADWQKVVVLDKDFAYTSILVANKTHRFIAYTNRWDRDLKRFLINGDCAQVVRTLGENVYIFDSQIRCVNSSEVEVKKNG